MISLNLKYLRRFALVSLPILALSIFALNPPAYAETGGYPDAEMPCVYSPYATTGSGYWCSGYNWGPKKSTETGWAAATNSSRGYGFRNCTDWVAYRVPQLVNVAVPTGLGNGGSWDNNISSSYSVDTTPEVGDIAVWDAGTYGHVAVVESVNANGTVNVSEYNKQQDGNYGTRQSVTADHYIDLNGSNSSSGGGGSNIIVLHDPIAFGNASDTPVTGDWSAAGNTNIGAWRSGTFYLRAVDGSNTPIAFGNTSDTPLSGNWDGPGATQIGIWRSGTFYLRHSNGNYDPIAFGNATDRPVTGDWNGDRTTDIGVWRNGTFYLRTGATSYDTIVFGNASDVPVTGDWDGDYKTDVGVWRSGTFYLRRSSASYDTVPYGNATDKPTTGDWDGNGTTDTGVWRSGTFYFNN